MQRVLIAVVAGSLVVAACGGSGDRPAAPTTSAPSTTSDTAPSTSTAPPAPPSSVADGTVVAAGGQCAPVPERPDPDPRRPRYRIDLTVDPAAGTATGRVDVTFIPDLDVHELVFRLWPNNPRMSAGGGRLDVPQVRVDGQPVGARQPEPTILEVPIAPVPAGRSIEVSADFSLRLPGGINDRTAAGDDWVRLGSFYPVLEWEPGIGWNRVPPTAGFAETSVTPVADYALRVRVVGEGFHVMASGVPDAAGVWQAVAVRDVAVTVGRLTFASAVARGAGVEGADVEVVVGAHAGTNTDPGPFAEKSARVLEDFARRFGPYPWPRYTLGITPFLSGGIEYPMHVHQGPGTGGRTTSHEIGHMWFYGLVGSHAGLSPWLDEGLASYAEARWEGTERRFRGQSIPSAGRGRLGQPMTYWEDRQSAYYRGVYVQGVQALLALGPADLVDCALRHYVARHAHRVVRPPDLLAVLDDVFPDAASVLSSFGA